MPELVSTAVVAGYAMLVSFASRGSAVSREAGDMRRSAMAIMESAERSIALFGAKKTLISDIYAVAAECAWDDWDGAGAASIPASVVERATELVRALPAHLPLPEIAPEPDGALSFDWIASRSRAFSLSVGATHRLSFAWIDGADRGHGVARFDGDAVPLRVIEGIRDVMSDRNAAIGAA